VGIGAKPHYISNTYKYYLDGYVAGGACPDLSGGAGGGLHYVYANVCGDFLSFKEENF